MDTRGEREAVSSHSWAFERRLMTVNFYLSSPWTGISPSLPVQASRMSRTKAPIQDNVPERVTVQNAPLLPRTKRGSVNVLMSHHLRYELESVKPVARDKTKGFRGKME